MSIMLTFLCNALHQIIKLLLLLQAVFSFIYTQTSQEEVCEIGLSNLV